MSILYKKMQQGGNMTGLGRKLTPEEHFLQRQQADLGKTDVVTTDLQDESQYLKDSYKVLSQAFRNKYPDVDMKDVGRTVSQVNPNYRPEWKSRADTTANILQQKYGDRYLTKDEIKDALVSGGLDPDRYTDSLTSVLDRTSAQGIEVPYQGTKEKDIQNWGWRYLTAPVHGVSKGEDRYFGLFNENNG